MISSINAIDLTGMSLIIDGDSIEIRGLCVLYAQHRQFPLICFHSNVIFASLFCHTFGRVSSQENSKGHQTHCLRLFSSKYANTNSKSVLGSMNDLAFHYKYSIQKAGGVHSPAVPEIIRRRNRMPMGALKYVFPIEALKALYQTAER